MFFLVIGKDPGMSAIAAYVNVVSAARIVFFSLLTIFGVLNFI